MAILDQLVIEKVYHDEFHNFLLSNYVYITLPYVNILCTKDVISYCFCQ